MGDLKKRQTLEGFLAIQRAEDGMVTNEEIAMEQASYAGFCKNPEAIAALEELAFIEGMKSALDDCRLGFHQKEGIWSWKQVKDLMTKYGVVVQADEIPAFAGMTEDERKEATNG